MTTLIALATLLMVPLTGGQGETSPELAKTEAEVHRTHDEFSAAWNKHDPKVLAEMWMPDGDYTEPDGRTLQGREAIAKHLTIAHSSVFKESRLTLVVERVHLIAPGVAIADGSYELFGANDPKGRPIGTRAGYFTTVVIHSDAGWRVSAARLMLPQVLIWRDR